MLRAQALRQETAVDSISPERAGSIMYDTLAYINQMQLQGANPLLISKIYATVEAMEADSAPVSDLTGQPLRPGQVVVIASSDSDDGSVYRYNGGTESRWTVVGKIGNLTPVDSLDSESTQLPLAAHQGKVLDGKITELGQEIDSKIDKLPQIGDSASDLDIADESANIIARFKNGEIKTKNFDSAKSIRTEDTDFDVENLSIADNNGKVVFQVKNGYPKTKNFDGEQIAQERGSLLPLWSLAGKPNTSNVRATLTDGQTMTLSNVPAYVKNGSCITFACSIPSGSNWTSLLVGKGETTYSGVWYEITATSIIVHYRSGAVGTETIYTTYTHGLTLKTYIRLFIQFKVDGTARIELETEGGHYSNDDAFCYGFNHYGPPFAKVSGGDLADIYFGFASDKYKKPIWIFGDSYFGTTTERVFHYLIEWGICEDVLVDALPGITAAESFADFGKCLLFGCPKTLVWMLGMNGTNASTIAIIEELQAYCEANNIELIINDVPTTPVVNNETLHNFVQSSGIRFVQSYAAVGANSAGSWYDGYLSSDNVHPTALGARAIAMRMQIDIPELMQSVTDRRG